VAAKPTSETSFLLFFLSTSQDENDVSRLLPFFPASFFFVVAFFHLPITDGEIMPDSTAPPPRGLEWRPSPFLPLTFFFAVFSVPRSRLFFFQSFPWHTPRDGFFSFPIPTAEEEPW